MPEEKKKDTGLINVVLCYLLEDSCGLKSQLASILWNSCNSCSMVLHFSFTSEKYRYNVSILNETPPVTTIMS